MKRSDLEISRSVRLKPIGEIAASLGLSEREVLPYGAYKAKVALSSLDRLKDHPNGKYILVTAVTPTPLGEGKTVNTIGLSLGLNYIGRKAAACIRQPSMGPIFGRKGGAAGGGMSQVVPMEDVNLHLTGDIHAVGAANNLLAAFLDNTVYHKNRLNIDPATIDWRRCLDMNDRSLRDITVGVGEPGAGVCRQTGFTITAASEVMGLLALSLDLTDMRQRLGRIVVALDRSGAPVTAEHLKCAGAMAVVMKEAVMPTLLQTTEHTPCFIHAGPFANISVGNSSIIADRIALKTCEYVVTESGFAADMGAEKFFNIKCRYSGLKPDAAVIVASVRSLKAQSGRYKTEKGQSLPAGIEEENIPALEDGLANLRHHIDIIRLHGVPAVVALNRMAADTEREIAVVLQRALEFGAVGAEVSEAYTSGGRGASRLAQTVVAAAERKSNFCNAYSLHAPIREKIETLAQKIYRAGRVEFSETALQKIARYEALGFGALPICMAKTQFSISHDPKKSGAPSGYAFPISDVRLAAGAGYLYPLAGDIHVMPGLPAWPGGQNVDIDSGGNIIGLF